MNDTPDEMSKRVGRLVDAATEHVKKHGLTRAPKKHDRRRGVANMGTNVVPIKPGLPGLPKPKQKGNHIQLAVNGPKTVMKIDMVVNGQTTWLTMNKKQASEFIAGLASLVKDMVDAEETKK